MNAELEKYVKHLEEVKKNAKSLMTFLRSNVGSTDDWPVSIVTDTEESSDELAELLSNLEKSFETQ